MFLPPHMLKFLLILQRNDGFFNNVNMFYMQSISGQEINYCCVLTIHGFALLFLVSSTTGTGLTFLLVLFSLIFQHDFIAFPST